MLKLCELAFSTLLGMSTSRRNVVVVPASVGLFLKPKLGGFESIGVIVPLSTQLGALSAVQKPCSVADAGDDARTANAATPKTAAKREIELFIRYLYPSLTLAALRCNIRSMNVSR